MREILFRAKDKDGAGWREGYYWRSQETTYCFKEDYERNPDNTQHNLLFDQMTDWGLPNKRYRMDIDLETLGQYTGILDAKGRRIFEGDIIQRDIWGEEVVGEVTWMDMGSTGFFMKVQEGAGSKFYPMGRGQFDDDDGDRCNDIVLGNIFDNPDLIRGRR